MRPSRAAALGTRYQLAETSALRASDSTSRETRRPVIRSARRTRTTPVSKGWGGAVMADDVSRLAHLLRWCGMALIAAGVLMVVATVLHPSRETAKIGRAHV